MSLAIRGVAHPPPPRRGGRANKADLTGAEISCTNLAGKPLLCEHDSGDRVGTVLASWKGRDGSLRVAASVEEPSAIAMVKNGTMRGLSLGTGMTLAPDGSVAYRGQDELSICEEGKRPGTWIDTIGGQTVRQVECFSKSAAGARHTPTHCARIHIHHMPPRMLRAKGTRHPHQWLTRRLFLLLPQTRTAMTWSSA